MSHRGSDRSPVPPEFQSAADAARKRYEASLTAEAAIQQARQKAEADLSREHQKTIDMGAWAEQLLTEAAISPDFRGSIVTSHTRAIGVFTKRYITEEVRTPVDGWLVNMKEGGERGTGSYWIAGTVIIHGMGLRDHYGHSVYSYGERKYLGRPRDEREERATQSDIMDLLAKWGVI